MLHFMGVSKADVDTEEEQVGGMGGQWEIKDRI